MKSTTLDRPPSFHIASPERWFALSADIGRCGDQSRDIALELNFDAAQFRAINSLNRFFLACYLTLLARHSNQSSIAIGFIDAVVGLSSATYEFEEKSTFLDVWRTFNLQLVPDSPATVDLISDGGPTTFEFRLLGEHPTHKRPVGHGCLRLAVVDAGNQFNIQLAFDGHSFRLERMEEFLAQYIKLAEQALASPQSLVLEYSLVTDHGLAILPDPTHDLDVPRYPLLTEAFADVLSKHSTDIAIRKAGQSWTYAELNHSSLILAQYLCQKGVVPGDVVAVSGPRSFGVVSSIFAVFRSGGTLLTIDPKLPLERQLVLIRETGAKFLVRLGDATGLDMAVPQVVKVELNNGRVVNFVESSAPVAPLPVLKPGAPAYIFFTSGSTGIPKGVVGSHQGLAHFLDWQRRTFAIGPGDRAAQITTLSFDMVLRDMFLALSSGATLCIPAEEDILDPAAILTWMATEQISILHLVPSLLRAWISHVPPGLLLPNLRRVFLAGEPLTDTLVLTFREAFGRGALITNFYGPTETTLIKCFHPVVDLEPGVQPVGKPQPQTQVLVLNRGGQLCGIQEIGELAIRTPFRTLGYLNDSVATAKSFVPNPFRNDPSDVIYMTGDSGYYRADGLLVMRGRIDNQVKIRGMRVEPGEVEAALAHCSVVAEAAVVAHEHVDGGKFLAAYIVPMGKAPHHSKAIAEMRDFMRARVPDGMVPAVFVLMDALPLLPNGKINRKALSIPMQPPQNDSTSGPSGVDAPRSKEEAELLNIWKSVLGHSRVGVNDSFIELGGDSLTAIRALVWMQRLGIPDSFAKGIFQGWTIRQITAMAQGDVSPANTVEMPLKAKTNLLVNALRGLLVAILVAGHWFEGLLNRLPPALRGVQDALLPLFSVATPGFAILFGLGLGYIHFPKYASDPVQVEKSLKLGFWLVVGGILIRSASDIGILMLGDGVTNSTTFFNTFYSALLYYAIAIATAPIWFGILARSKNSYRTILLMIVGAYLTYQGGQSLLLGHEQVGLLQLCRLMVVAKFNYFNMSVGALLGMAAGIYLHNWSQQGRPMGSLWRPLSLVGMVSCVVGLGLLYSTTGSFSDLKNEAILPMWKWIFYGGTLSLAASGLSMVLTGYGRIPSPIRVSINLFGVLGQISLPVFVLHQLVLRLKALLVFAGMPDALALILPLVSFLAFCGWMMYRLYALYYGSMNSRVPASGR